jgi:NAD(P)-dependent dehydrogenase (short-subunit alcohol dehydrogenase family)
MSEIASTAPRRSAEDHPYAGQTVIVTGAAAGIGRATVQQLAAEGARVIACDISPGDAASVGSGIVWVEADVTKAADVERVLDAAGPDIDGLANVAGVMDGFAAVHEVTDAMWARVMDINVTGPMRLMRAVLPGMLERGRGSIVNVASIAGVRGSVAGSAYTTSKHAVIGLTRSAAVLYGPQGIRVNVVAPGSVQTSIGGGFDDASGFVQERLAPFREARRPAAEPDDIADVIVFLLGARSRNVNGCVLHSDGGWSAS